VRAYLQLDNATIQEPEGVLDLGVLPGTRGGNPDTRNLSWTVRVDDVTRRAHITVVLSSEKAGTVRHGVPLPAEGPKP
jgi:hypothetical protein